MSPREWFDVGIRLLGVWMMLQAIDYLAVAAELMAGWTDPTSYSTTACLFHAAVCAGAGIFLLTSGTTIFWPQKPIEPGGFEVTPSDRGDDESRHP